MTDKPKRQRPAKVHLASEFNPHAAACSMHKHTPLTTDPDLVTCRTCRQQLPPRLPAAKGAR